MSTLSSALFSSRSLSALIFAATVLFHPLPPFTPFMPSPSLPLLRSPSTMLPASSASSSSSLSSSLASMRRSIRFMSSSIGSSSSAPASSASGVGSRLDSGKTSPPFPLRRLAIARMSAFVSAGCVARCASRRRAYSSGSKPSGRSMVSPSRSRTFRYLFTLPASRFRRFSRTARLSYVLVLARANLSREMAVIGRARLAPPEPSPRPRPRPPPPFHRPPPSFPPPPPSTPMALASDGSSFMKPLARPFAPMTREFVMRRRSNDARLFEFDGATRNGWHRRLHPKFTHEPVRGNISLIASLARPRRSLPAAPG